MKDIDVIELKEKMDRGDSFIFIDVREPFEYEMFNLGATLIPLGQFAAAIPEFEEHKDDEIIIHCRSGMRSETAKQMMIASGFKNVRNLLGGVLDWQSKFIEIK